MKNVRLFGVITAAGLTLVGCGSDNGAPADSAEAGQGGSGGSNATGGKNTSGSSSGTGGLGSGTGGSDKGGSDKGGNATGGRDGEGNGGDSTGDSGSGGGGVTPRPPLARESDEECRITPKAGQLPSSFTPGKWTNISPKQVDLYSTFGANSIDLDPTNPLTLYASLDELGIWKSTDAGTSWTRLGKPGGGGGGDTINYIDSPLRVAVDPCDPNHLYATEGVRGSSMGFWVSIDGGATWKRPKGFASIVSKATEDITTLAVDPNNFAHILLGSHSAWDGQSGAGVLESRDFGETWTMLGPKGGFQAGSVGIGFGSNSDTWLVSGDEAGTWRTTDAGNTWKKVSDLLGTHGGSELYRDSSGALYFGGFGSPYKSTDDGATWKSIGEGLPYNYYLSVGGDGKRLYTAPSFPADGAKNGDPIFTSTDGVKWSEHGSQDFDNGPYRIRFDSVHGVLYTANWQAGVWALKVAD